MYISELAAETFLGKRKGIGDASNNVLHFLDKKKIKYVSLCQHAVTACNNATQALTAAIPDNGLYVSYRNDE